MGVHIHPQNRPTFAANQPTPQEAQQAIRGYTAYYGTFKVDEKEKFVVYQSVGQVNLVGPVDRKRFYDTSAIGSF
jgi:hypothetical protein